MEVRIARGDDLPPYPSYKKKCVKFIVILLPTHPVERKILRRERLHALGSRLVYVPGATGVTKITRVGIHDGEPSLPGIVGAVCHADADNSQHLGHFGNFQEIVDDDARALGDTSVW